MKSFKNRFLIFAILSLSMFDTKFTRTAPEETTFSQFDNSSISDDQMKEYTDNLMNNKYKLSTEEQRKIAHKMLNLDPQKNYTEQEITKAHRKAMLKWHPDKNFDPQAPEVSKALGESKDILLNNFSNNSNFSSDEWTNKNPEPVDLHQKLISGLNDEVRIKLSNDTIKTTINDLFTSLTADQQDDFINILNKLEEQQPGKSIEELITKAENDAKLNLSFSKTDRLKNWWKKKTLKNFTEIFKSDKTILKEYIQKSFNHIDAESKINTNKVQNAVAKLSRTQRMDLFNDITHEELDQNRSPELRDTLFTRNEALFRKILPQHEMLVTTADAKNSIASTRFKIVNMRQVDPNLSLAENAEMIENAQDLNYNLQDLEKNMRQYLERNPSPQSLKALLVDAMDKTRKNGTLAKANEITKIFDIPGMKDQFDRLSPKEKDQFITSITKAELQLKEKNMNLAGSGAKVSYAEAQRIFKENAVMFEKFVGPDKILAPIESASRNDASSFNFETIDISSIKDELNKINMPNVNLEQYFALRNPNLTDNSPEYNAMIENTGKLINIANKLKSEQNLKLNINDIAQELKNYIQKDPLEFLFGTKNTAGLSKNALVDIDELFPSARQ